MRAFASAAVAAMLLGGAAGAQALEISIENETDARVTLAFSYLDSQSGKWTVDGWYNVDGKSRGTVNLNSDNSMYYLYAEFSNGKRIEGGEGAVNLRVLNRSFSYVQDDPPEKYAREVSFLRARGNGGKATVRVR